MINLCTRAKSDTVYDRGGQATSVLCVTAVLPSGRRLEPKS